MNRASASKVNKKRQMYSMHYVQCWIGRVFLYTCQICAYAIRYRISHFITTIYSTAILENYNVENRIFVLKKTVDVRIIGFLV